MENLMQESKTRKELLENTINHFNENNRSAGNHSSKEFSCGCHYRIDGKGCAIGREITDELAKKLDSITTTTAVSNVAVFEQLPDRLKEMGQDFLREVQQLHDGRENWDENGLTKEGKEFVGSIKIRFEIN